ncbi:45 kDa calcium-binding protein [Anabrus simplex]|uniref:45 kDa calcium-binding protein n=1 Tax=Anabrus simplex TaxID=316456 RepID=UPI0034DCD889
MAVFLTVAKAARTLGYISCQRWSIVILLLLYAALFLLTWPLSMPLRSLSQHSIPVFKHKKNDHAPDPLEAILIEKSAKINKDFVGSPQKVKSEDDPKDLLESIFHKADIDSNGLLSLVELADWINAKIQEHINQALQENFGLFTAIDTNPRNGMVSWEEYHNYFLLQKGLSKEYADNHDKKHKGLERSMKETIMRDRASWSEAARSDPDHLTLDEFLAFRHPESSHATILTLVEELFDKFDRDGDELLTEDEFSSLPTEADNEQDSETLKQGEEERRREFRDVIDQDGNGKADRKELLMYIDPKNPRHAREEAETLMVLSDVNHDGQLSLPEILNKMDLFLGSKMVDTARSFHDEF